MLPLAGIQANHCPHLFSRLDDYSTTFLYFYPDLILLYLTNIMASPPSRVIHTLYGPKVRLPSTSNEASLNSLTEGE